MKWPTREAVSGVRGYLKIISLWHRKRLPSIYIIKWEEQERSQHRHPSIPQHLQIKEQPWGRALCWGVHMVCKHRCMVILGETTFCFGVLWRVRCCRDGRQELALELHLTARVLNSLSTYFSCPWTHRLYHNQKHSTESVCTAVGRVSTLSRKILGEHGHLHIHPYPSPV